MDVHDATWTVRDFAKLVTTSHGYPGSRPERTSAPARASESTLCCSSTCCHIAPAAPITVRAVMRATSTPIRRRAADPRSEAQSTLGVMAPPAPERPCTLAPRLVAGHQAEAGGQRSQLEPRPGRRRIPQRRLDHESPTESRATRVCSRARKRVPRGPKFRQPSAPRSEPPPAQHPRCRPPAREQSTKSRWARRWPARSRTNPARPPPAATDSAARCYPAT
jgi:hypothetical protein